MSSNTCHAHIKSPPPHNSHHSHQTHHSLTDKLRPSLSIPLHIHRLIVLHGSVSHAHLPRPLTMKLFNERMSLSIRHLVRQCTHAPRALRASEHPSLAVSPSESPDHVMSCDPRGESCDHSPSANICFNTVGHSNCYECECEGEGVSVRINGDLIIISGEVISFGQDLEGLT